MKIKCEYCGSYLSDTEEKCPNCGATNAHLVRAAADVPATIEALRAFCEARALPLEEMRFFIGEDYAQPKAFGIFKDANGDFVVYKNKADGSRAVRYRGKDEAYAVNEIYQKLRAEVVDHKSGAPDSPTPKKPRGCGLTLFIVAAILIIGIFISIAANFFSGPYDDFGLGQTVGVERVWQADELPSPVEDSWQTEGGAYADDGDTDLYGADERAADDASAQGEDDWSASWDDGDDWSVDSGSWDSGSTDWDSDW